MIELGNRKRVLAYSNDPNTIMSYGIIMNQLMENTSDKFEWNLISEEYKYGRRVIHEHYIKWCAGKDIIERDTETIPNMIQKIQPEFFFSVGDVQHFKMTRNFVKKHCSWIHYLPIDNNDRNNLLRNAYIISNIDVPVAMSKFGRDFCLQNGLPVKKIVYPFIKTSLSKNEEVKLRNKELNSQFIFRGFHKVLKEEEEDEFLKIQRFKQDMGAQDKKILLFVGRPGWRKNVQFLLGCLKKLIYERERDDIALYMHSDVNDPASTVNIAKLLHAFQIPDGAFYRTIQLEWHSGLPEGVMNALYNLADVQVSTHGGEGFGLPLAEGLAAELPFVATDCTTTPELSGNNEWSLGAKVDEYYPDRGIMRPYIDLDDFCDKVEYLIDNQEKREVMGKKGRDWVVKNCSYDVIRKEWLKIFDLVDVKRAEVEKVV